MGFVKHTSDGKFVGRHSTPLLSLHSVSDKAAVRVIGPSCGVVLNPVENRQQYPCIAQQVLDENVFPPDWNGSYFRFLSSPVGGISDWYPHDPGIAGSSGVPYTPPLSLNPWVLFGPSVRLYDGIPEGFILEEERCPIQKHFGPTMYYGSNPADAIVPEVLVNSIINPTTQEFMFGRSLDYNVGQYFGGSLDHGDLVVTDAHREQWRCVVGNPGTGLFAGALNSCQSERIQSSPDWGYSDNGGWTKQSGSILIGSGDMPRPRYRDGWASGYAPSGADDVIIGTHGGWPLGGMLGTYNSDVIWTAQAKYSTASDRFNIGITAAQHPRPWSTVAGQWRIPLYYEIRDFWYTDVNGDVLPSNGSSFESRQISTSDTVILPGTIFDPPSWMGGWWKITWAGHFDPANPPSSVVLNKVPNTGDMGPFGVFGAPPEPPTWGIDVGWADTIEIELSPPPPVC